MIEHSFERNSMAECPLSFASSSLEPITRLWARSVAICNTCRPDAGTAVITCSRIFWSMLWYINKKNTQKNSKNHDHSLTFCITVRIIFFYNFPRLSRGRCWSTFAYVYSSFLLLKQWIPWIGGLITGLGDCQEYSSSIWSGVEWLPPQFHLTKQLKAFVSALQVYHKSGRFSLVQFLSTAQREKPTIS